MEGIEISGPVLPVETICGPVSDFKELTLASNAITMGHYGFIAGVVASALFFIGRYYVGPRVVVYGQARGWWE
jgi:hypothetical protein